MGIVGNSARAPQRTNTAPAQAAPQQAQPGGRASRGLYGGGFAGAKPKGANGEFLRAKRGMVVESGKIVDAGEAGVYRVRVNKCSLKSREQAYKGNEAFIVEFEVIESNVPSCPPGYQGSWVTIDAWEGYLNDVKGFVCELYGGADPAEIDEGDMDVVLGQKPPPSPELDPIGKEVCVIVKDKLTKKGNTFTQHLWQAATEPAAGVA